MGACCDLDVGGMWFVLQILVCWKLRLGYLGDDLDISLVA